MSRLRRIFAIFLPMLMLLAMLSTTAGAVLLDVGPTVPPVIGSTPPTLGHGFPLWYRDFNRVPLELCVDEAMCLFARPNPAQPVRFPDNMPDEVFFHSADATMATPAGSADLITGVEGNILTETDGSLTLVSFARVRIRVDTNVAGTYVVTTPYKQYTFTNVPVGLRGINFTEDIGIGPNGHFQGALAGSVGPFLYSQGAPFVTATGSYVGNLTALPVLGSSFIPPGESQPANYFRVQGPAGFGTLTTNLFTVTGKLYPEVTPTPLKVDKVTYAQDNSGIRVNAFATTEALSNQTNNALPFPQNFALTGALSTLQLTGAGIPTQNLFTNSPADGRFFSASSIFSAPGIMPTEVTVTNTNDIPPTVKTAPLVDEVVIDKATFNTLTGVLSLSASSYDKVANPALQAFMPGMTAPLGTLANGQLNVTFPVTDNSVNPSKTYAIPPATVSVASALGGSATAPVTTFIQASNYAITSGAAPNGSISPAGVTSVAAGSSQTYIITPNTGFKVDVLVVDGTILPGATSYTFTNVTADHYINAYFTEQSFTITASAGANGAITPPGVTTALYGTASSFAVTPNAGFQIASLVVDGMTLPATPSYTFTSITGNHTISATFAPVPVNFSITANAAPNGAISPAGVTAAVAGTNKTFIITPNAGFTVTNLVVDGTVLPGAPSYTFSNVAADHYINAYFGAIVTPTVTITAGAAPNGAISPAGANTYTSGTDQTFTITPDPGFTVTALSVDGTVLPGATSFTFTNVTTDHYINAYFGP
jgi:hypothetical protein